MTKHSELKVVPFKPEQLFEMVADVKSYPKFLPWCVGARIRSVENELIVIIGDFAYERFKIFRFSRIA